MRFRRELDETPHMQPASRFATEGNECVSIKAVRTRYIYVPVSAFPTRDIRANTIGKFEKTHHWTK